jgi:hypothetical protein
MPAQGRRRRPAPEAVVPVDEMLAQTFVLHCRDRHPNMRLRTKNEHEQDHRIHKDQMDHVHQGHAEEEPPQGMDPDTGRSPQDDWLKD